MTLAQGQILNNRYSILKLLGQGGFGAVYRAWDLNMDRLVAVKENLDTTPQAQRQFYREAQILFDLSHPNLPRVMDHFVIQGQGQYLMMEFIEGQDLQEMLQQVGGPLPEEKVLLWIGQVCDALTYLHSQNPPIIHRDIKPANIKITPQGKAFLVDFGIAKIYDPKLRSASGASAVTPGYSPIEQYGQGITDAQSDIYALGATMYHLMTGIQPPASVDIIGKVFPPPRSSRSINPAISSLVNSAIDKAMQLEKKDRWRSISDFKSILTPPAPRQPPPPVSSTGPYGTEVFPEQQVSQPWQSTAPVVQRALPWRRIGIGAIALFMLIGFAVIIYNFINSRILKPPTPISTTQIVELISSDTVISLLPTTLVPPTSITQAIPAPTTPAPLVPTTELPQIPTALPLTFIDEQGVSMALVPAGSFKMGENLDVALAECEKKLPSLPQICTDRVGNEEPVHNVYLDSFYIDIYEVTNSRYQDYCVNSGLCKLPTNRSSNTHEEYYGNPDYFDFSVINTNWDMADKYCQWRGARLPTEAEWEKSARGGLERSLYPWGNDKPNCRKANYEGCNGDVVQVGKYESNGYGLFDMAGNVFEWVEDWYSDDYYTTSPEINPIGPSIGQEKVFRGGAQFFWALYMRVSARNHSEPNGGWGNMGFRCARSVDTIPTPTPSP